MKAHHFVRLFLSGLLLLAMISCNKDATELMDADTGQDVPAGIEELVELVNVRYLSSEVSVGEGGLTFEVRNDGLIDEYTANEQDYMSVNKQEGNSFLLCLRGTEPSREQVMLIRRLLHAYEIRNERIILNHRLAFRQLQARIDSQRQALYRRYQAGYIDQEAYRTEIQALRLRYQEALAQIRVRNAAAFSRSFEQLLRQLENILTEEQWAAFSGCVVG